MKLSDIFPENERPLDTLLSDGGFSAVFRTVAAVGDSLSSGEFEAEDTDGKKHYFDMFDYSWGQYIARINGQKVYNFSRGGMTAKEYMESFADENGFFDPEKRAHAYIIALGYNDVTAMLAGDLEFGGLSDIDKNDYKNNKHTFVGYYAQVIQKYKEINPDAHFFLVTMPYPNTAKDNPREIYNDRHRDLLESLCGAFSNTYLIDLRTYAPEYDNAFREKFFLLGHMNPAGYLLTAKMIVSYIDFIVRHDMGAFKKIGFMDMTDKEKHELIL